MVHAEGEFEHKGNTEPPNLTTTIYMIQHSTLKKKIALCIKLLYELPNALPLAVWSLGWWEQASPGKQGPQGLHVYSRVWGPVIWYSLSQT